MIDKILLGHNQFIGVDHMSQKRGAKRDAFFEDLDNIKSIIYQAIELGATGMMLSTHSKSFGITDMIRNDSFLRNNLNIYPLLPYLRKYMKESNELGIVRMLQNKILSLWKEGELSSLSRAGLGYLTGDFDKILEILIDFELKMFKGLKVKAIFLHNGLTDLAVSLNLYSILKLYSDYIKTHYSVTPGFCTVNYPRLISLFKNNNHEKPLVMAPFNLAGYQMSPSKKKCEEALNSFSADVIAMSTLASGYVRPDDAYQYLYSLPNIKSTVVGVSSKAHAIETFQAIKKYSKND